MRALCLILVGGVLAGGAATHAPTLARDRYFDITVTRATCGYEVLPRATWMRPEGQYCIVHLRFRNVTGAAARLTLTAWFQHAYTSDGTRHPARTLATAAENRRHNPFFEKVEPGSSTTGLLVFDIPVRDRLTSLRIKESIASTGVTLPV
jgi:hypothetical protein